MKLTKQAAVPPGRAPPLCRRKKGRPCGQPLYEHLVAGGYAEYVAPLGFGDSGPNVSCEHGLFFCVHCCAYFLTQEDLHEHWRHAHPSRLLRRQTQSL
ncbi:hypothetical protein V5799_005741 [Amblyomma americanum]|uniref:C2H2-type domain-containing protein n=1 Tax=Amblyomma americanum TaxID=6943 RepID=A0AAQ4DYE2_AMBAM